MEPVVAKGRLVLAEYGAFQVTLGSPGARVTGVSVTSAWVTSAWVASAWVDSSPQSLTPHALVARGVPATNTTQSRNPPRQSTP